MAGKSRASADALNELAAIERDPSRYDFFQTLRLLEALNADRPRLGRSARAAEDRIRLRQEPSMAFAPRTLAAFRAGGGGKPAQLDQFFFGLFGPNGPLPLHLTEYAHDRKLQSRDPTFSRFGDIFHHRMLSFFYRAWADAQPATHLDRLNIARFCQLMSVTDKDPVVDEQMLTLKLHKGVADVGFARQAVGDRLGSIKIV